LVNRDITQGLSILGAVRLDLGNGNGRTEIERSGAWARWLMWVP
jgi:hypothetical protein